jgi:hypothetical protein
VFLHSQLEVDFFLDLYDTGLQQRKQESGLPQRARRGHAVRIQDRTMQGLVCIVRGVHDFTYTLVVGPVVIMIFAHMILPNCRVSTNRRHGFNVIELS